ncbi:MAG: beta-ketoacyl-ACP synthase II [Deltaproteobacteria bacterium]|nr:beta-ketoacyl-ACP synthase II [Deltaproteobacteria bacterium]
MRQGRRVVITGLGLVTPLGVGVEENWAALMAGRSGVRRISRFDPAEFPVQIAGEVPDFDPHRWVGKKDARHMDRFIHFAVAASMLAFEDAGLSTPLPDPERAGTLIGVGLGGLETLEAAAQTLAERGPRRLSPFMIPQLIANLAPGHVSMLLGTQGPNLSSVSACATGAHSVGDAARLIAWGEADLMVAGGAEATITPLGIGGFAAMKALSTRNDAPAAASRPFDRDRDGFVSAEGAGVLVLEEYERARARGARVYAEVAGYGQSSDAHHITQPAPDGRGARAAMRLALEDARLDPSRVQYLNAHGTSTPAGDIAETRAIRAVFGVAAEGLWVSSTKSMLGHMLGAAGAVELAVCALAIARGQVPPTINLDRPDPECDLDYVPHVGREGAISATLSNSFGFGGTNVSVALTAV